jgi:SAM-dependent methyltransferase
MYSLTCLADLAEKAVARVEARFPFPGYFAASPRSHVQIADVVLQNVARGGAVLDFGAGPLDKTAVLAELGYRCSAVDDLSDPWHLLNGNRERILAFAESENIDYRLGLSTLPEGQFDLLMAHDVLEHLHDSPQMLVPLLARLRPGGLFFVTVPNAANLRKRLDLIRGRTNLPLYAQYFWETPWRGHVREYVLDDLRQLAEYLAFDVEQLRGVHHLAHRLPRAVRELYLLLTIRSALRDSLMLLARKPEGWVAPKAPSDRVARAIRSGPGASPYFRT